jgi:DNA polymerase III epsilon subunit-like protein
MTREIFISVDVETAGPIPEKYALLSIGACLVSDISNTFYVELKPDRDESQTEALAMTGLNLDDLRRTGLEPEAALTAFNNWIRAVVPADARPIFVAFNAPFDWMFVNDYFHRYIGENPFGHSALDIKAYFMGQQGVQWSDTSMKFVSRRFLDNRPLTHNALRDAQDQAEIFRKILALNPKDKSDE